ncbi:MAG: hypothetical protein KJ077_32230 [Anaerolineae bacterium]|nr:hypothetical protein [Anaerolineae bacterium]
MEKILVYVKDKEKAQLLSELLMALDFVESVNTDSAEIETNSITQGEVSDFFALAGLWEGREIDLNSIRQRAWPRQSS